MKNNDKLSSLLDKKLAEVKSPNTELPKKPAKNSKINVAASRRKGLREGEVRTTIILKEEHLAAFNKIWYLKSSEANALNPVKIKDLYEEMFDCFIEQYAKKIEAFEKENGEIPTDYQPK